MLHLSLKDQALLIEKLGEPFKPNQSMENAFDVYEQYLSLNKDKK